MSTENKAGGAVATTGDQDKESDELSPLQKTAQLVAKYAKSLINDQRSAQFYAQVLLLARKNPKIAMCTPDSLLAACMACVHLDLMPNTPEQLAFIIPYNNKAGYVEAQFQVGYKGLIELAYRSAGVASINAELVFPQDIFELDLGKRTLSHKPDLTIDRTQYDKAVATYAVAQTVGSDKLIFDVVSKSEIEKIRGSSKTKSTDTPWFTWEEMMVKKTAVKRLTKWLPQSSKDNRLQLAAAYDSWAESGKLAVDANSGEVVQTEKQPPVIDHDKIKAEAAAVKANLANNKTVEGNDPHKPAEPQQTGIDPAKPGDDRSVETPTAPSQELPPVDVPAIEKQITKLKLSAYGRSAFMREATGRLNSKTFTEHEWRAVGDLLDKQKAGDFDMPRSWQAAKKGGKKK